MVGGDTSNRKTRSPISELAGKAEMKKRVDAIKHQRAFRLSDDAQSVYCKKLLCVDGQLTNLSTESAYFVFHVT